MIIKCPCVLCYITFRIRPWGSSASVPPSMKNENNDDIKKLIDIMSEQFVGRLNNEETRMEMTEFIENYAKKVYPYSYEVMP